MRTIYSSAQSIVKMEGRECFKFYINDEDNKKILKEACISECLLKSGVKVVPSVVANDCLCMPFFKNGDVFSHTLEYNIDQIDCIFKQLVFIISKMHSAGVAHRDIKLENIIINNEFEILLTDFGTCDVFKLPWETIPRLSKGVRGSVQYIAPEEFTEKEFSATNLDIWALGILYISLYRKEYPWGVANKSDVYFSDFLKNKKKYLKDVPEIFLKIIEPDPLLRATIDDILEDSWFKNIKDISLL